MSAQRFVCRCSQKLCSVQSKLEATQRPSIDEWINKLLYIYTMESFPGVKGKHTTGTFNDMNEFPCIILREGSQAQKNICCMVPFL